MIYFDPTESRHGTRLAYSILQVGKELVGLEEKTGADILITTTSIPGGNVLKPPGSIVLKNVADRGFLIQRKSNGDLLNSIPNLLAILRKMRQWGRSHWLGVSGVFVKSRENMVVVEGRTTGWKWNALSGALDAWQIAGGNLHMEETDNDLGEWILKMDERLPRMLEETEHTPQEDKATLHLKFAEHPWRSVLEGFPDLGATKSEQIAEYCGDLRTALWWMSEPEWTLPGIGKPTKAKWREFMGMLEDEVLVPVVGKDTIRVPNVGEKNGS